MLSKDILTQGIGERGFGATYLQELLGQIGLYDFHWNIRRTMDRRAFFTTEDGDIGNAFHEIRVGDMCHVMSLISSGIIV